ncbi:MAG: group II truncated hemoglobin [Pseudomonadota bacterium]
MSSVMPIAVRPANTPYQRLGGHEAVVRLVDAFYHAMDTRRDARTIRAMHEADLTRTKAVLVKYLCEWLGGEHLYSDEFGAPALRRRHHRFDIDEAARDAWMACMRQALTETCADKVLRSELEAAFWKMADYLKNTEAPKRQRGPRLAAATPSLPGATEPLHGARR